MRSEIYKHPKYVEVDHDGDLQNSRQFLDHSHIFDKDLASSILTSDHKVCDVKKIPVITK